MGHLPRRLSGVCSFFLRRGSTISCTVTGGRRYSIDLYIALTLTFVYSAQQRTCIYRILVGILSMDSVANAFVASALLRVSLAEWADTVVPSL